MKETRTIKIELEVSFNPLNSEDYNKRLWGRIEEAYLNDTPIDHVDGYGEDFWVDNIHLKK